jgi:hypothetical protein
LELELIRKTGIGIEMKKHEFNSEFWIGWQMKNHPTFSADFAQFFTPTAPFTTTSVIVKIVKTYVRTGIAKLNDQKCKKPNLAFSNKQLYISFCIEQRKA